jgi:hypothetical protein
MGKIPTKLIQETDELLAEAGLGSIPSHLPGSSCAGPFQVRMLDFYALQFLHWLSALSKRFGLPAPRQLDFRCSAKLEKPRCCMESAFFFDLEGMTQLKNLITAAFEGGEQPGFLTQEI